jgi:hypothetical protein
MYIHQPWGHTWGHKVGGLVINSLGFGIMKMAGVNVLEIIDHILEIIDHLESEIRRALFDAVRRVGSVARGFVLVAAALLAMAASTATAAQYETLRSQSRPEQERILRAAIIGAGYSCPNVTAILFKGSDRDGAGYWTAVCSDGGTWMVQVKNDPAGTMSVTSWALLNTLNIEGLKKF